MAIGLAERVLAGVSRKGAAILSRGAAFLHAVADELEHDGKVIADLEFDGAVVECVREHVCGSAEAGPCNGYPRVKPTTKEMLDKATQFVRDEPEWILRGLEKQAQAAKRSA